MAQFEPGEPALVDVPPGSVDGRLDGLRRRLRVLLALLAFALGFSFTGPWLWWGDLLAEFRPQLLLGAGVFMLAFALLRAWPELALAAGIAFVDLLGSRPAGPAPPAPAAQAAAPLRVVHFNALKGSPADAPFVAWIAEVEPALVFVQEVDGARIEALSQVPGYVVLSAEAREDNFGIVALARAELRGTLEVSPVVVGGLPAVQVALRHDGLDVRLLSTHTLPPAGPDRARARNQHLAEIGGWVEEVREVEAVPVVIGDLNATPWAHPFRQLVAEHHLVDSRRGHGVQASWPAPLGGIGIPIDHCLHDPRLVAVRREVGPHLGSDHRPILVELARAED